MSNELTADQKRAIDEAAAILLHHQPTSLMNKIAAALLRAQVSGLRRSMLWADKEDIERIALELEHEADSLEANNA